MYLRTVSHSFSSFSCFLCFPFFSFHFPHHFMEPINIPFGFLKNKKIEMQCTASLGLGQFHCILFPFSINVQFTLLSLIVLNSVILLMFCPSSVYRLKQYPSQYDKSKPSGNFRKAFFLTVKSF